MLLTSLTQAFEKHTKDFYASKEFKEKAKDAEPFFRGVKDYVFGRPTTLENIVRPSTTSCEATTYQQSTASSGTYVVALTA
jgi:hypothetical protein